VRRLSLILCLLLVVGCATATPTPAPPAKLAEPAKADPPAAAAVATPTAEAKPAAAAAATPAPTPADKLAAPTPTAAAKPTEPAAPATKPAEATKPAGNVRTFLIDGDQSEVKLLTKEQFAGINAPSDAVLSTKQVNGQILVDAENKIVPNGSKITVQAHSLRSDEPDRDAYVHQFTLESAKFPTAEFAPKEFRGLPSPVPSSGPLKGQIVGDLTVHGVTKPATFDFEGTLQGDTFKGKAKSETKLTDFAMHVPRVAILLTVEDRVRYEFDVTARAQSAAAAQPKPTAAATGPARRFQLKPEDSEVTLRVQEQLAGATVNTDAVLQTKAIAGQIVVQPDGKVGDGSKFTVELNTLKSDRSMRDAFIKRSTLEVEKFPQAEFVAKEFRGLGSPLPTSGKITGQLVGDLTLHGVTKPVTFNIEGDLDGNTFKGRAFSALKITDFGMELPRVPVVAGMEDLARMDIAITATAA
jgi:polyisoprenoid-binding protein YceI